MRFVFVPWELSVPALLSYEGLPDSIRLTLAELNRAPDQPGRDATLARIEKLILQTSSESAEIQGSILLFYAAALWQAGRWLDVVEVVQKARHALYFSITPEARYHEALAAYQESLVAFSLRADARAEQLFRLAQSGLQEATRYWGHARDTVRMQASQELVRWISDLLSGIVESPEPELLYLLPLFEEVQGILQRVGVLKFPSPYLVLPEGTLTRVYEAGMFDVMPLSTWRVPLLSPTPGAYYYVQRILADGDGLPQAQAGDLLLLERSDVLPEGEHGVFIRRYHDGRILFRTQSMGRGFSGIAKALLRRRG